MGVRWPGNGTNGLITTTLVTTATTIVLISAPLNISIDFQQVMLFWYLVVTAGTGTTSLSYSIRRTATTAGATVTAGVAVTTTAGNTYALSGCYIDTPGIVAEMQWNFNIAQGAASGNGTVLDGAFLVLAL